MVKAMTQNIEFSATEIRQILQAFFPHRRLVLSQFTFFNQVGVAKPTGETFRRGRRCYKLEDVLPIAAVLALKEEGIPLKNIETVPAMLQENSSKIFATGQGCRLSGFGDSVILSFPGEIANNKPIDAFLSETITPTLYWAYDVGILASQLQEMAARYLSGDLSKSTSQATFAMTELSSQLRKVA
jgi:DNA-binding transcriptional MerR regulator